ncbi:pilus motility taxis protein HmpF [Baaleninema sp.]|uniref:pilus motility taxis protein HmpF n=1 Tax=Baaleninema sp. TaxID=3101197 RepID=UPI003D07F375
MLYLAEVLKKSGVFGSGKTELKLLAMQRGEYNWMPVTGDDVISADEAGNFNSGALVFAELTANKQLQGTPKEAGGQLVKILQNFSRFQEKFKTQEEEIEQWKQSLTYQSQELNRREMEMEARREELENVQQELSELEAKRGEIEASNAEMEQLRAEVDRSRQELEAAWEQLQGERESLQHQQSELQDSVGLDAEQAESLQQWLQYLAESVGDGAALREPLAGLEGQVSAQQGWLEERTTQLEQWRSEAEGQQGDLEAAVADLDRRWEEWRQLQLELEGKRVDLAAKERLLEAKQQFVEVLRSQVQSSEEFANSLSNLPVSGGENRDGGGVDWEQLERMPLNDLQQRVRELQSELETGLRLVIDEQEELMMQRLDLNELEAKLARASDADRPSLQAELADQQESYKFLNETLIGQRRSLRDRERIMNQHQSVLWRRLGNPPEPPSSGGGVDVGPLQQKASQLRQQLLDRLQALEGEINGLQPEIDGLRQEVEQKQADGESRLGELQQQDRELRDRRAQVAQLWGKVNTYHEVFDPLRDRVNEMKSHLEALSQGLGEFEEMAEAQRNAVSQLQASISGLMEESASA